MTEIDWTDLKLDLKAEIDRRIMVEMDRVLSELDSELFFGGDVEVSKAPSL